MSELFDAVDALVASRSPLPPPAERKRLRQAHGLTLDEVATALQVRRATVGGWEAGRTEPRPPERDAYARMLKQLAQLYPAGAPVPPEDTVIPDRPAVPAAPAPSAAGPAQARTSPAGPAAEPANTALRSAPAAVAHPAVTSRPMSRRPDARKAASAAAPAGGTAMSRSGVTKDSHLDVTHRCCLQSQLRDMG